MDLDTGELFVLIKTQWRCSGFYCMNNPFDIEKLWKSIEHNSAVMKNNLEMENQTQVVRLRGDAMTRRSPATITPFNGRSQNLCSLPRCDAATYKKNYVRDRTQSALTYILEYSQMQVMINKGIYDEGEVQQRLRAVFGRVDAIRKRID